MLNLLIHKYKGEACLLIATILAAVGWVSSKIVLLEMPGSMFIGGRFILASALLLPFCYQKILDASPIDIIKTLAVGCVFSTSIHIWVYAVSITNRLTEGAFIMALAMIIAPLTSWLLFRTRPNQAFWYSLPLAGLGMALLTLTNGWEVEKSQLGFFFASCFLSIHFVLNKRLSLSSPIKPLTSICLQMFVVGLTGFFLCSVQNSTLSNLSSETLIWFIIASLIATALRYLIQTVGQYSVNIEIAALIMILEPIWTLVLSITMLKQHIEIEKLLGCLLILVSLILYMRLSNQKL
ncbi:DMT family transporter [Vibrio sp. VB16]|uniref:DMT family transporter n=1 Tax=Vibrio sp. VB16 TaxID=2785746 RepID=UPI001E581621|nr:DMT family transporter [Vibrio sp. VB16]UGA56796.1 DMT family transporter [Vibrio sp. VB16]